jgi:hypothetical protein
MNFLQSFPADEQLLPKSGSTIFDINCHIHTPYSYSAFDSIAQIFEMADREQVRAVGINDFIVTDGYRDFHEKALQHKVFPFFNIEFMCLLAAAQNEGARVNDPSNPGRAYFSGKGLDFPSAPDKATTNRLKGIKESANHRSAEMIENLNDYLRMLEVPFGMTYEEVKALYAEDLVRERHIAKALRIKVFQVYKDAGDRSAMLTLMFAGKPPQSGLDDYSGLENEIRSNLLKVGGPAFIPEDEHAFLSIDEANEMILKMGGIPCYPVLLDDNAENFTEFESDFGVLRDKLLDIGIGSIELIPGRNDIAVLKDFVKLFHESNFVITFGTEHNTSTLRPLKVTNKQGKDLQETLRDISYQGACVIAAHQYLRAHGKEGYVGADGVCKMNEIDSFRKLGARVFNHFFAQ